MAAFKNRFDKMFEGYENQVFFDANGKQVTRMVYTGVKYIQQLEDRQRIIYKVLYLVLMILGIGLIIFSGIPRVPGNYALYVNIPQALCIVAGVLTAMYVFTYVGAQKAMDRYTYQRANGRLKVLVFIAGCISLITFICSVISIIVYHGASGGMAFLCAGAQLLSAVCYFIIFFLEYRTEYIISE